MRTETRRLAVRASDTGIGKELGGAVDWPAVDTNTPSNTMERLVEAVDFDTAA